MYKKLFSFFLALLLMSFSVVTPLTAKAAQLTFREQKTISGDNILTTKKNDNFLYFINEDNTITITKYTGASAGVTIPELIDGIPVTAVGDLAFFQNEYLENVTFPIGLKIIGIAAFKDCRSLQSIELPPTLETIKGGAFANTAINCVVIPNSVKMLDDSFRGDRDNDYEREMEGGIFENCRQLKSVIIQNGISYIGTRAFSNCQRLKSIYIPNNVKIIQQYAFSSSGLEEVTIGKHVRYIINKSFYNCNSLKNIYIKGKDTKIQDYAFQLCDNVTIHGKMDSYAEQLAYEKSFLFKTIPDDPEDDKIVIDRDFYPFPAKYPKYNDFYYNVIDENTVELISYEGNKDTVDIPESIAGKNVISIHEAAFYYQTNIMTVDIPEHIKTIGESAFQYCFNLKEVKIPDGVSKIERYAFFECSALTDVYIPQSVNSIGENCFKGCNNLTISGHKNSFAETFAKKNNGISFIELTDNNNKDKTKTQNIPVNLPDNNIIDSESIIITKTDTFKDYKCSCTDDYVIIDKYIGSDSLVQIPDVIDNKPVKIIGKFAFSDCSIVETVIVPEGVRQIANDAFSYCPKLSKLVLPQSLMSISFDAFEETTGFTIFSEVDSYGKRYALRNHIPYVEISKFAIKPADIVVVDYNEYYPDDTYESPDTPINDISPERIMGDIDGDDDITSIDALLILRASVGLEKLDDIQHMLGDLDGDTRLTSADSLTVLRYSVGLHL